MTAPHVSISAETLFHLGPLPVTNSLLTTWIVLGVLVVLALVFRLTFRRLPSGLQNLFEMLVEGWLNIIDGVTADHRLTRRVFPVIVTLFLFILLNNWAGLIPGVGSISLTGVQAEEMAHEPVLNVIDEAVMHDVEGAPAEEIHAAETPVFRPASADLSFTLTLAIIAVVLTQYFGMSALGSWGYLSRFINFHSPVLFLVGLLELVLEFAKIISFGFRLFGNIFAGEVLLTVMIALVPFVIPMPFYGLEIFVGAVQALVFSMLTLVFFKMATVKAH